MESEGLHDSATCEGELRVAGMVQSARAYDLEPGIGILALVSRALCCCFGSGMGLVHQCLSLTQFKGVWFVIVILALSRTKWSRKVVQVLLLASRSARQRGD